MVHFFGLFDNFLSKVVTGGDWRWVISSGMQRGLIDLAPVMGKSRCQVTLIIAGKRVACLSE